MKRITEHIDYCFLACYERQGDKIREECPIYYNCYSRQMHEKLSHYEDLEEQGLLVYPKPELNDCEECGSLGEFGGCLFFGYGKDTQEQCRKRMAKLKELKGE